MSENKNDLRRKKIIISSPDNTLIASKGENSDFLSYEKYNGNSLGGGTLPLSCVQAPGRQSTRPGLAIAGLSSRGSLSVVCFNHNRRLDQHFVFFRPSGSDTCPAASSAGTPKNRPCYTLAVAIAGNIRKICVFLHQSVKRKQISLWKS